MQAEGLAHDGGDGRRRAGQCPGLRAGRPGFPSQQPNRALNNVMMKPTTRDEWYPMSGLAAAPEIATAVPSVIPALSP